MCSNPYFLGEVHKHMLNTLLKLLDMYSAEQECPVAELQLQLLGKKVRLQEEKGGLPWGSQHAKPA